jgi:hypothetical protein
MNGEDVPSSTSSLYDSIKKLEDTIKKVLTGDVSADDQLKKTFGDWYQLILKAFTSTLNET